MSNQNIQLLAVIITSVFKEENFVSARMISREVANTGLPKLPLDDLKYLTCVHADTIYSYSYKGMLSKSIYQQHVHDVTEQQPTLQLKLASYIAFVLFTRTSMMELGRASSVVGGHFRKQKGFRYIASYSIRLVDSTSSPDFVFDPLMCSQGPVGKEQSNQNSNIIT